nr:DUF4190 domain-containing protein [Actinomycetota bacterium]
GQPTYGGTQQPQYGEQPYGVSPYPAQGYQQYGAQQYAGYPAQGYPAVSKTNGMAIGALIASLAGGVLLCGVGALVGAVLGHIALGQIKKSGEQGHGMALAAVIVGWIIGGLGLVIWTVYIIVAVVAASSG